MGVRCLADRSDRAYLDAADLRGRDARSDLDGLVQVPRLDEIEAGEAFLGLGERAVGDARLAVAHPNRCRGGDRLQGFRRDAVAARADGLVEGEAVEVV